MAKQASLPPIDVHGKPHTDRGYCYSVPDGLDGYCVHTATCVSAGRSWSGPNSSCVREGQDGFALKAQREGEADRRRFTPPQYRAEQAEPSPTITTDRRQPVDVLALRGRPRGVDGKGVGEWTTWETYTRRDDDNWLASAMRRASGPPEPAEMTSGQARAIVAEFEARVPAYEFKVVRARLVVREEVLA